MTTIEIITHVLSALVPTLGVLAFLLLHRRQSIQADLETAHMRQLHCQLGQAAQTERMQALSQAAIAFAPALPQLIEHVFPKPPTAADLSDEDLVAELDRRIETRNWKHGNPFGPLDDLLERLWSDGVEIPPPGSEPPISTSRTSAS
jgi:hypothetical protein